MLIWSFSTTKPWAGMLSLGDIDRMFDDLGELSLRYFFQFVLYLLEAH